MSRAADRLARELAELVLLRGATPLRADSLEEIATLGPYGLWRTPGGAVTEAIGVPRPEAAAVVSPAARAAAHRDQDAAWLEQALDVVRALAREHKHLTVDDCWANVAAPPTRPTPDERADGRRPAGADPEELGPPALDATDERGAKRARLALADLPGRAVMGRLVERTTSVVVRFDGPTLRAVHAREDVPTGQLGFAL